ncbi:hypothetical protein FHQ18_00785 [Deferribacter autotrophicus]|uniref:Uncharacterized protein n=2 Tax=Deferribacter autotrophicus TaxID=500465 RepID=A0A5A8F5P2_9BACT|nr:hypothetical protein FHQ18_00785 [Deferribacter autotrophicus]
MFFLTCSFLPSAVFANSYIVRFLKMNCFASDEDKICLAQFFSVFNFISPISIPILIYAYLLRLPIKTVIIMFILLSHIFFIVGYLYLLKKRNYNFMRKKSNKIDVLFYFFIMIFFYYYLFIPESIMKVVSVTIVITFVYSLFTRKLNVVRNALLVRDVLFRSGVIVSILIMLFFMNMIIIYGKYNVLTSNFFTSFLSDRYIIIVFLLCVSFILLQFIDPMAVLIVLYPFYRILIDEYNFNEYVFGMGYILFLSLGFFSYIKNLVIENYILKFKISYEYLGHYFLKLMLLISLLSSVIMIFI